MSVQVDDSGLPFVVVRFMGKFTDEGFDAYLRDYVEVLERQRGGEKVAIIIDARQSAMPSSRQARLQADFLAERASLLADVAVGTAFVIASPIIRGALKAILWMQPMPTEHTVVETLGDAEAWARAKLEAAGVSVPDGPVLTSEDATG